MKNIYIHIGNFKTGSSAIQQFCSKNRSHLLEHGIDYLPGLRPMGNSTNHGKLALSLLHELGIRSPQWFVDKDRFGEVSSAVRSAIDLSPCENILLSSEEFYRLATLPTDKQHLALNLLSETFEGHRIKPVIFVRPPMSFIKSWYNQVNKALLPCSRFIDFFYETHAALLLPQYNISFWSHIADTRDFRIEPYENRGWNHIDQFLSAVGCPARHPREQSEPVVNTSRDVRDIEKLRLAAVWSLKQAAEREKYLRTRVFLDQESVDRLKAKISSVNRDFSAFCQASEIDLDKDPITLEKLLLHEESVNRKDVSLFRARLRTLPLRSMALAKRGAKLAGAQLLRKRD